MATDNIKLYFDACCYIDLAQSQLEHPTDDGKQDHVWYCKSFLDAARSKDVEIVGSTLLVAECTAVRDHKRAKILTDEVKATFRSLLMGGNPVIPIQPTPKILDRARDLSWIDGFNFQSMDAIHIATAIAQQCNAFVTTDKDHFLDKKQSILQKLKINVCTADSIKEWLPDKYKQEKLRFPKKK